MPSNRSSSSGVRALVLGATGFIGGAVARAACEAGMDVRGLRRRAGATGAVGDLLIDWREGDLADAGSLRDAMAGCDVVFHAAGYAPDTERDTSRALQRGVAGMRTVLSAVVDAGIGRIVYTSSLSTIGSPPPGVDRLADERDGYLPGSTGNPYYEVKWAMEHEALRAARDGLPVVILCPTAVFGPGDVKPSTGRILLELIKGRLPASVDMVMNVVDGRDVALAHVRAASAGVSGERYIIGGHNLTIPDAFREAAQIAGVRSPRVTLSLSTARALLALGDALRLPIPATMRALPYWQPLDMSKARRAFGLDPRPFAETVRDTVAWFREHGYV
jgi:dihydroflavonol-4-reductase